MQLLPYANLQIQHWNPGATMPLVLPVHVICNTSDEDLLSNIRSNARLEKKWQQIVPAHDKIALLCGSGPSIADYLSEIEERQSAGQIVFAMNGAAKFLNKNGIYPDYQVILDARIETADLIGPAREHLFASQVHPECFKRVPNAKLWHLQIGGIEKEFPDYPTGYCLVGGGASVGNTAACLAYAMGYRNLQIYGYDSSHRNGASHAFRQPMNDGDPECVVKFDGKEYTASLTMKLQAEKFHETAVALKQYGCTIEVHGDGLLPAMFHASKETLSEAEKYEKIWSMPEYRQYSPGELVADKFLDLVKPDGPIIDFGCGSGRGALRIFDAGHEVIMVDFASNCLDDEARVLKFVQADLTKEIPISAPYGFCTDVMEHIPTDDVDRVIQNIMQSASTVYFQISTIADDMGILIAKQLHLTVRPHDWWHQKFWTLGYRIEWEDGQKICSSFLVKRRMQRD